MLRFYVSENISQTITGATCGDRGVYNQQTAPCCQLIFRTMISAESGLFFEMYTILELAKSKWLVLHEASEIVYVGSLIFYHSTS